MNNILETRIAIWKKKLLDLGKRNRLINFKEGLRNNVKIVNPNITELYNTIVNNEHPLAFPYAKNSKVDSQGNENYGSVINGDLETTKTIGELQKTLRALRLKAKSSIEEQGVNVLYLTFGAVHWQEKDNDTSTPLCSPIIIVPVKLTIQSSTSPYVLSLHEDEIVVNPSLSYKFSEDFAVELPEFDSDKDDLMQYFEKLEQTIANKGWSLTMDTHLTILSFQKINMYNDLDKHHSKLLQNNIISSIAGTGGLQSPPSIENYDHDLNTKPIDTFQVVDADSSQQDAILLSRCGASFVLQGPPGTGKSQTITNIITHAMADGKKVLFVAEKMAALQVVYNRLSDAGLSNFCFNLHSQNVKKTDILKDLANSMSIAKVSCNDSMVMPLEILNEKRSQLNAYQRELHTPCSGLNCSIFDVNGYLAKLSNATDLVFDINDVQNVNATTLNDRIYLLGELVKTFGEKNSSYTTNVWRNANIPSLTNEIRHDISSNIPSLIQSIEKLQAIFFECCAVFNLTIYMSYNGLNSLIELMRCASNSPTIPFGWINGCDLEKIAQTVKDYREMLSEVEAIKSDPHLVIFDDNIVEIDVESMLMRFRSEYTSFMRGINSKYKSDIKTLRKYTSQGDKLEYEFTLNALEQVRILVAKLKELAPLSEFLRTKLKEKFLEQNSDWEHIDRAITYAVDLKNLALKHQLAPSFIEGICQNKDIVSKCASYVQNLEKELENSKKYKECVLDIFDKSEGIENYPLDELITRLKSCANSMDQLEQWIDYRSNRQQCIDLGMETYITKIEMEDTASKDVVSAYLKRFYRLWLDAMLPQFPSVAAFRGRIQEQIIRDFCELDKKQFDIAQLRIRERLLSQIPDFNVVTTTQDEIGILKRELGKKRKIMPLRQLLYSIPNLISTLRPCFMMSPLSVSLFLDADIYKFDMVIFDEASQVHTQDAIGAIMRGKQVIIVGDTKQLPPTNFFANSTQNDDFDNDQDYQEGDDAEAFQSILDEAATVLPQRSLLWHYRSKHEDLIAFSNAKIYNHSLVTFPSAINKLKGHGVEYIYVKDGVYDRGDKRCNTIEANRVAELVIEHFTAFPERSLGVVTFSEAQMAAVDLAIRQIRQSNPDFDNFFMEDNDAPFFIKNIENVQGDERDTIIFSIGYAKDVNGVMSMNFGALNKDGGERRLNVAITRAKHNVKLVGSILPSDIDTNRTSAEGVRLLRSYIEFAQHGLTAVQSELNAYNQKLAESNFEQSVYEFLVSKGYEVEKHIGYSEFKIDLAIKDPNKEGVFAIGIESDGFTYHSSRTARDRDRNRHSVLQNMGWTMYRIWSTDWIKDQKTEEKKLVNAIERALGNAVEELVEDTSMECAVDQVVGISTIGIVQNNNSENNSINNAKDDAPKLQFQNYIVADIQVISKECKGNISDVIKKVIEIEQPLHFEELCVRVAPAYGNPKVTAPIKMAIQHQVKTILTKDIEIQGDFITLSGFEVKDARIPEPQSNYIRSIARISPQELLVAMKVVAERNIEVTPMNLIVLTAKELGEGMITPATQAILNGVYQNLLDKKDVFEKDGKVHV